MEQKQLYRKKSVERIQSPEQLNDYLRVTGTGVWLALAAVCVTLIGALIWSGVGWLEASVDCEALSENGEIVASLPDARTVRAGMIMRVGGLETQVDAVRYDEAGNLSAVSHAEIPDGIWNAEIVLERVHPLRFLFD